MRNAPRFALFFFLVGIGCFACFAQSESADERKRVERQKLESLLAYAEATDCRRQLLLGEATPQHW